MICQMFGFRMQKKPTLFRGNYREIRLPHLAGGTPRMAGSNWPKCSTFALNPRYVKDPFGNNAYSLLTTFHLLVMLKISCQMFSLYGMLKQKQISIKGEF